MGAQLHSSIKLAEPLVKQSSSSRNEAPRARASGSGSVQTYKGIQVITPPKRQGYRGRGRGSSLNMHSQQSMNYTHQTARRTWPRPRYPSAFLRQPRSGAQRSTLQQAGRAGFGERSLIGELTLHRGRPGPRGRASAKMAQPARQPSQHDRSGRREESRWRGRAARVAQTRSSG
jgi:hypothetical protein